MTRRAERIGHLIAISAHDLLQSQVSRSSTIHRENGDRPAIPITPCVERCHAIDHLGLAWIEEPIVYDNLEGYARLTADLKTPVQIGENFYGPRALYTA